jgi:hypothetical protein
MSTKTNFKRVALVAVAALGLGVLTSVAPASAALSAVDSQTYNYTGTTTVGLCKAPANSATAGNLDATANATQVGEVLNGGVIGFTRAANDTLGSTGDQVTISISGPGKIATASTPNGPVWGADFKSLAQIGASGSLASDFTVATTGVGSIQITISTNASGAAATVFERYTFTVSASCATGTFSAANSLVKVSYRTSAASASVPTTNTTETTAANTTAGSGSVAESADRIANGGVGHIAVRIMDGQSTPAIVTSAGVFGATATNGAVVSWAASDSLQSSSSVEAVAAGDQFNTLSVYQGLANEDKPLTTVVTITYNGTVIGTRTINFTGIATKITIDSANAGIGKASTANILAAGYEITDAAGNKLTSTGPGITGISGDAGDVTNVPLLATSGVVVDTVNQSIVTAAASSISTEASTYHGAFGWTCGSNAAGGKADIYLKYTFSNLTSLVSNTHKAQCGSTPVNYKASLDKASYAPGEIATLTITATDSKGNAVYDVDDAAAGVVLGSTGASTTLSITLPQLTGVSTPTNSDVFVSGAKTYKFTVGTTEGSFAGVVDLPKYNSTTYAQTAQTVSYKVAGTSTGVTNADVLKAIVSLIASINKQIAALQKALLKK